MKKMATSAFSFLAAFFFLAGPAALAQNEWTFTATGGNSVAGGDGQLYIDAMQLGVGYATRPRPYGLEGDYSVSFVFRLNTHNNHWLVVYFDGFVYLNIDWGTELKYWNGDVSGVIKKLEAGRTYRLKIEAYPSQNYYDVYLDGVKAGTAVDAVPGRRGGGFPSLQVAPEGVIMVGDGEGTDNNRGNAGWMKFSFPSDGAVAEAGPENPAEEEPVSDLDEPNEEAKFEPAEEKTAAEAPETREPAPVASVPGIFLADEINLKDAGVCQYDSLNGNNADWGGSLSFSVSSNVDGIRNTRRRAYLWFDIHAVSWGTDAPEKVELELNLAHSPILGNVAVRAFRVTGSWMEGDGVYAPGRINPDAGDGIITWNFQPGWDASKIWAEAVVGDTAGPVRWDITDLVRAWRSGRFPNHGLVLVGEGEGAASFSKGFVSSEGDDAELRPKIILNGAGAKVETPPVIREEEPPAAEGARILAGVWSFLGLQRIEARHEYHGSWVFKTKPQILIAEWWVDFEMRAFGHKAQKTVTYDLKWIGNGEGFVAESKDETGGRQVIEAKWAKKDDRRSFDIEGRFYNVKPGQNEPDFDSIYDFTAIRLYDDPRNRP